MIANSDCAARSIRIFSVCDARIRSASGSSLTCMVTDTIGLMDSYPPILIVGCRLIVSDSPGFSFTFDSFAIVILARKITRAGFTRE